MLVLLRCLWRVYVAPLPHRLGEQLALEPGMIVRDDELGE